MARKPGLKRGAVSELLGDTPTFVALGEVELDNKLQPRSELDEDYVEELAQRMRVRGDGVVVDSEGSPFPPIRVMQTSDDKLYLYDGWHRQRAALAAGAEKFQVDVKEGSWFEAFKLSLGVNAKHGKRRTNEDKRNAAIRALTNDELKRLSDYALAEVIFTSAEFVRKVRAELERTDWYEAPDTRIDRSGKEYVPEERSRRKVTVGAVRPKRRKSGGTAVVEVGARTTGDDATPSPAADTTPAKPEEIEQVEGADSIFIGDFREVLDNWSPGSVDALITRGTDDRRRVDLWARIATSTKRVLSDEGLAITFVSPGLIGEVVTVWRREGFRLVWTAAVTWDSAQDVEGVASTWTPALVWARSKRTAEGLADTYHATRNAHGWSQVAARLLESLDVRGHVCDPMAADGALVRGAVSAGSRVVAIDQDADNRSALQRAVRR